MAVEESLKTSILGFKGETPATYTVENFSPEVPTKQLSSKPARNAAFKPSPGPFQFRINTGIASGGHSPGNQYQLPLSATGRINATVDWGDGTRDTIQTRRDPAALHTYPTSGIYTIKIYGEISNFNIVKGAAAQTYDDRRKLLSIENWGEFEILDTRTFEYCINLETLPVNGPKISTNNLSSTFFGCWKLNGHLDNWDMSGVTNLSNFLREAYIFNQPISSWQTQNVTTMSALFFRARRFNQPINTWNVNNVTSIGYLFYEAFDFNQPLDNWDVSNVYDCQAVFQSATSFNQDISGWNTTNWFFPQFIFSGATSFNQPIGNWDATNWAGYRLMLRECDAFDQDISSWPPTKSNNGFFMEGATGLSPVNYNKLLDVWSKGPVRAGLTWDMGGSTYTLGSEGEVGRDILVNTYGLTFIDGGGV